MVKKHELSYNNKHKQKKSWLFAGLGLLLVAIIVVGAVVVFSPSKDPLQNYDAYNGFAFEDKGTFWQTNVQLDGVLYEVPFYTHPLDIVPIYYDTNVTSYLIDLVNTLSPKRDLIIAVNPDGGSVPVLAGVNIARITGKFYGVQTNSALYIDPAEDTEYDTMDFPIRSCKDGDLLVPIIWISVNKTNPGIYFHEDNPHCIVVSAESNDLILEAADYLGYKLLGIVR